MNKEFYFKAALIGGCVTCALMFVPILNLCCPLLIVGGVVAVYILTTSAPGPVTYGDGAVVGMLAGLIGGGLTVFISMLFPIAGIGVGIFALFQIAERLPLPIDLFQGIAEPTAIGMGIFIIFSIIGCITYIIFGMLGGVIGTAIFVRKKKEEPPAKT